MSIKNGGEITPEKRHRNQVFTRIVLPVALSVLLIAGLGVFIILVSKQDPGISQTWAHITLTMMMIPIILLNLVLLTFLILAIFGISGANRGVAVYLKRFRQWTEQLNSRAQNIISKPAEPIIRVRSLFYSGKVLLNNLRQKINRSRRS